MPLRIVQLGTPRGRNELRIGTVRRPPRGVRKEDYSKLDYYDVWLPILSPSADLVKFAKNAAADEKSWNRFKRKFQAEMKRLDATHALELIAALSHRTDISIGCYCEDENRCHRSVLKELLGEKGARFG
jgi:uncharacterized protein YeaO (DUF488 family)